MNRQREKRSVIHKVGNAAGIVLSGILILILSMNCILIFKSLTNMEKVPGIGGIIPMIVLTDSMYPQIQSGDLIVCRTREADKVREGDVIAFFDPAGNGRSVVTHRVRKITKDEHGNLAWVTKGDANNTEDQALVPAENLVGIYRHRVAGLGSAAMFLQTTQGMILCVICPILLMVVCDTICRRRNERSEKKAADALRTELETLRAEKEKHI